MKILILGLLFVTPLYSYKFLCNSVTASGQTESDSCGVCLDGTGPRWPSSAVQYSVSTQHLPSGLSVTDWLALVQSSFASWTQIPGVSLTATFGLEGNRSFGTDVTHHDIFWVTDENEWMEKVGAAPNGILGVTLPPYTCPQKTGENRVLGDADMILNAVPAAGFAWEANCPKLSKDCQSIRGTMTHEMGHFLGLGHPFSSGQALMSARSTYLIEYPLFDDQQGLLALYPAVSSLLGVGGKCSTDSVCQAGLTCHSQASNQYCSHGCQLDSECSNNLVCAKSGFCEFPSGARLGAVALHGDCSSEGACDLGLICVGVGSGNAYCFSDCTTSQTCGVQDTCHQLHNPQHALINFYACMQIVKEGSSCGQAVVCETGLLCTAGTCVADASAAPAPANTGCSSSGSPPEFWILLCLLGILVPRLKKKC